MAAVFKRFTLNILLMYRRCYKALYITRFKRGNALCKAKQGILAAYLIKRAGGNGYFLFPAVKYVYLLGVKAAKVFHGLVHKVYIRHAFAVKVYAFIAAKNNRYAHIQHAVITECFNDQFNADAVKVSRSKANYGLLQFIAHAEKKFAGKSKAFKSIGQ